MSDAEQLGRLARDVLENEAFIKGFDAVKEKLTQAWIRTKDQETREQAWQMVNLLEKVKWELEYFMDVGNKENIDRKKDEFDAQEKLEKQEEKDTYFATPLKGTRTPQEYAAFEISKIEGE